MNVSIAHDYLLQHGGAERVVATWVAHLPTSKVYSLAYSEDKTFDVFRQRAVYSRISNRFIQNNIEYLLPLLPALARRVRVEGESALISTSGWAHRFSYDIPTVAYVHSPARWLYAQKDYSLQLGLLGRLGLAASAPSLRSSDVPAMHRMDAVVSNSRVSQTRVWEAYGIDSEIIHPPVERLSDHAIEPDGNVPDAFALVVSRNRGYKNVQLAILAARAAGMPVVVVGSGSEVHTEKSSEVIGLGRVSDSELKWLYQNTRVLIGSAHEDFGLTVLEANLEGAPVAAIPLGGYLETVKTGINGVLAEAEDVEALSIAVRQAISVPSAGCTAWAADFSASSHMSKLMGVLQSARS